MNNFSEPVEKIVNNYLKRLKKHLKGLPDKDKEELLKEVHSHIYESFINDPAENEIERIFIVLDKLGEPAEVVSSRMPAAIVTMGKKKKLPLYILSGILIALFGIPLGLTGKVLYDINVKGKAAHGFRPHLGVNAVEDAAKIIANIDKLQLKEHPDFGTGNEYYKIL